ncbi:SLC13 family permease [Alishewanella tabrizica]|uniref:SLC13 family permease n=1 Tax=Alishewanella tabrizica TaxID=671278 RepID=A0ABQ2WRZ7_9ALTE|nr:SLC13 family permease [Alishewanella tabrizica]GGW67708.1 SLC13 family permease [Alishewanella tabrizica]
MSNELWMVLALLLGALVCFVINKPRSDVVALTILILFPLTGVLSVADTLAGFSNPTVILIAALFVVGDALVRTGIVYRLGDWLVKTSGSSEIRLVILLMSSAALLSSVMSSTGVVAVFIPVVLSVAARLKILPGRLLMPLAFAALIGGMLTLVATPPNMVVNNALMQSGQAGFNFFSFTPIGLTALILGIGYMLLLQHWLAPKTKSDTPTQQRLTLADLAKTYCLTERELRLRVASHSPLLNQPLNALGLRSEYGINVVAVERSQKFRTLLLLATGQTVVQPGDILLVDLADPQMSVMQASAILGLEPLPLSSSYFSLHAHELGLAEVAFPPESSLPGKSIQELAFRSRYRLNVLGIRRNGQALNQVLVDEKLQATDTILVAGTWQDIQQLHQQNRDFLVLSVPAEIDEMTPAAKKAPHALACLALMVFLMVSDLVPAVVAVLITCLSLGACRCIDLASAYKAISWPSIMLIVGMLPFAQALQLTGGVDLLVNQWLSLMGNASYHAVLAAVFILTTLLSLFISNTATAVLMAPVAISLASAFQASPYPFAMMVALGASAAFMTPVASPVNTLVLGPGQFKFSDFLKIGTPLTVILLIISVIMVPWLYPLHPNG